MSALVPMLLKKGHTVTGSDPVSTPITDRLKGMGVRVAHEHRADAARGADVLVASSAIASTNPEMVYAQENQIPVLRRAELLGGLLEQTKSIVVTGAHGKTSITGMLTQVLIDCGLDPNAYIGGEMAFLGGNSRVGEGAWSIAEGDESDGSFIHLRPDIALINNIDTDHMDYYADLDSIIRAFQQFIEGVQGDGWVISSADCANCRQAVAAFPGRRLTYGFSENADVRSLDYQPYGSQAGCGVGIQDTYVGKLHLTQRGRFMYHNALGAIAVAHAMGLDMEKVFASLSQFPGVQRRMEVKGIERDITVIDDYAHHPAEIEATIAALREQYAGRVIGIFQPHLYSRTVKLQEAFGQAFRGLDELILTDIYPAREEPMPGVTGEILLGPVLQSGVKALYIEKEKDIVRHLLHTVRPGETVVTLGAGSIWRVGEQYLDILRQRQGGRT